MIEQMLKEETEKWIAKAKTRRKSIRPSQHLKNIDAYMSDSEYFLSKGDLIHAFEAIIWAWSWIEILEELKQL